MNAEKKKSRSGRGVLAALLVVVLAGAVFAQQSVYDANKVAKKADGSAQTWYRTASTGTDSVTAATPVDRQYVQGGDTYIQVRVRGTSASSTHVIQCWTAGANSTQSATDDTFDFATSQTATLSSATNPGGNGYTATAELTFSVAGKTCYDIRHVNASAGTIDLEVNTIGAASTAAE